MYIRLTLIEIMSRVLTIYIYMNTTNGLQMTGISIKKIITFHVHI